MLKIGIIDVTTVGSTICQRRISELGGSSGEHPEFFVHSLPFSLYKKSALEQDWQLMDELISRSAQTLNKVGVDFIIIPSNTPHYAYDAFAKQSTAPILNLIEITAKACKEAKLKRVAILGTQATMTGNLYDKALEQQGLSAVTPDKKTREAIHQFIFDEIIPEKINHKSRQAILDMIKALDCDGFILGCTELPEVFSAEEIGRPAVNTTRLIAETAFALAQQDKEKND